MPNSFLHQANNNFINTAEFSIITMNANGQGDSLKRKTQFTYVKSFKPSVVFFQETHSSPRQEQVYKNEFGASNAYFSHGTTNARGVSMFFAREFDFKVQNFFADVEGRYLWVLGNIKQQRVAFLNLYSPNDASSQLKFIHEVHQFLIKVMPKDAQLYIAGDLNLPLNYFLDKKGANKIQRSVNIEALEDLLHDFHLVDGWRYKYPTKRMYTWSRNTPAAASRIDYSFCPESWMQTIEKIHIKTGMQTDHKMILTTFKGRKVLKRGPGLWKLNTSFLKDENYCNESLKIIQEARDSVNEEEDPQLVWIRLKNWIAQFSKPWTSF